MFGGYFIFALLDYHGFSHWLRQQVSSYLRLLLDAMNLWSAVMIPRAHR